MRIEDGVLFFRHWNYPELSLSEISEQEWYQIERKILNNSINTKIILDFLKSKRPDQQARFQEGVNASEKGWEVVNSDLFLFLSSLTQSQLKRLQSNGLPFPHLSTYQRFSLYKVLLVYLELLSSVKQGLLPTGRAVRADPLFERAEGETYNEIARAPGFQHASLGNGCLGTPPALSNMP